MISLYKPHMPSDLTELQDILYSGNLACGIYSKKFEDLLGQYIGGEPVLAINSFHMAISVVLSVFDIGIGDEVIASPMACLASTQPIVTNGVRVIWADVDPHTGTLDPDSVRQKITQKTKAIIHNHFCGYPGYIDEILDIGRTKGIYVIDDGIEAFGSEYKSKKTGNCGADATVFSFTAVRIPNTIDGGAVILRDRDLYMKALQIRDCGIDRKHFRDELGEINPEYDITLKGYSATMSNVNAYLGIQQMKDIESILEKQRKNAHFWKDKIQKQVLKAESLERREISPNYWVYGMLVQNKREEIVKLRESGWYASGVHLNNNRYSLFGKQSLLPGVQEFYEHYVAVPCGWWIEQEEKDNVKCNR